MSYSQTENNPPLKPAKLHKIESGQNLAERITKIEHNFFAGLEVTLGNLKAQGPSIAPLQSVQSGSFELHASDVVGKIQENFDLSRPAIFGYDAREKTARQLYQANTLDHPIADLTAEDLGQRMAQFMVMCQDLLKFAAREFTNEPKKYLQFENQLKGLIRTYQNEFIKLHNELCPRQNTPSRNTERTPLLHGAQRSSTYSGGGSCSCWFNFGSNSFCYNWGQNVGFGDGWGGNSAHSPNILEVLFDPQYTQGYYNGQLEGEVAHFLFNVGKAVVKTEIRVVEFVGRETLEAFQHLPTSEAGRAVTIVTRNLSDDALQAARHFGLTVQHIGKAGCECTEHCCSCVAKTSQTAAQGVSHAVGTFADGAEDVAKCCCEGCGKACGEGCSLCGDCCKCLGDCANGICKCLGECGTNCCPDDCGKALKGICSACLSVLTAIGSVLPGGGSKHKPHHAAASVSASFISENAGQHWGWHLNGQAKNQALQHLGGGIAQGVIGGVYVIIVTPEIIQNNWQLWQDCRAGGLLRSQATKTCATELVTGAGCGILGLCVPDGGPLTACSLFWGSVYVVSEVCKAHYRNDRRNYFGDANYREFQLTTEQLHALDKQQPGFREEHSGALADTMITLSSIVVTEVEMLKSKSFGGRVKHGWFGSFFDPGKDSTVIRSCREIMQHLRRGDLNAACKVQIVREDCGMRLTWQLQQDGSLKCTSTPVGVDHNYQAGIPGVGSVNSDRAGAPPSYGR